MDDVTSPPNFRALFEAAPDIYLVLSPDLTIVAASDACCMGSNHCAREKMVGRNLFDVFPTNPGDPDQTAAQETRASLARVLQFRRPDRMGVHKYDVCRPAPSEGSPEHYWSTLHAPVLNESGEVGWIIHRVEDVTEMIGLQREAEASVVHVRHQQQIIERLQKTSRFLDAVIDNVPGMLFVKSYPDCRYVLLNREAQELVGYQGKNYFGKTDYDLFTKEQADYFAAQDRGVFESGEPLLSLEEPTATRDKGMRVLRTTKIPVKDKDGRTEYLLGFSEDITERKELEQQLRQALKMEAIGQLTGGIAHDFNNLLGIIIGNLDVAAELAASNPDLLQVIHDALAGALRGAELTRRLLAFSRKRPLQPEIINLNQVLPDTADMLRRTLGEQVVVELHLGTDPWPVRVDPGQLDEAILNLAINARDAMPQGGVLSIETRNAHLDRDYAAHHADVIAGAYVHLSISDTGSGMPPDVLERCFEPFYTTKSAEKGTGLGLSTVYGFVKRSDGHIKIYSEVGHGTTVHIYLPRAGEASAGRPRAEEEDDRPLARGSELVLIVEDNEDLRAVTVKQLSDLGYRTLEARNAKQALEVLAAHPDIDLLLTDIVMPGGMAGTDLARKARQLYPKLKVLLTSGYTARTLTQGFGDIEGLELLSKPYRRRDLATRLRAVLDRA